MCDDFPDLPEDEDKDVKITLPVSIVKAAEGAGLDVVEWMLRTDPDLEL